MPAPASSQGPPPEVWSLSSEPTVEIGSLNAQDEATIFSGVRHGMVLEDGTIVVGDRQSFSVRVFDARGAHLRTFGREGEGPGEFAQISRLSLLGPDTVVVHNNVINVQFFSASTGELLRTLPAPHRHDLRGLTTAYTLLEGSRFLLIGSSVPQPPATGVSRPLNAYMTWDAPDGDSGGPDGAPDLHDFDTLGVFPGVEAFSEGPDDPLGAELIPMVGRSTHYSAEAGRIYIGDSATDSISVFRYDGTREGVMHLDDDPLSVTARDREAVRQRIRDGPLFEALAPHGYGDELEARLEKIPLPATHPTFVDLVADRVGRVWVRRPSHAGEPRARWDVYSPDGGHEATVQVPSDLRILDIGRDYLLAVWVGELDVEYVRLYGLSRNDAG